MNRDCARLFLSLIVAVWLAGCGDTPPAEVDAGPFDAGRIADAGSRDGGSMQDTGPGDAGPGDAGPADAGPADAGTDAATGDAGLPPSGDQLVASVLTTCARRDGAVRCWGVSGARLGYGYDTGHVGDDEHPASLDPLTLGGSARAVGIGNFLGCALLEGGTVRCWGAAVPLGYGNSDAIGDDETPADAGDVPLGGTATAIAVGKGHACALMASGGVRCWGFGNFGRLGYGNQDNVGDDETPADVGDVPLGGNATQVALGDEHSCALMVGGAVRCWGRGVYGPLGYGDRFNIGDDEAPSTAGDVPLGEPAVAIAAGGAHTCALLSGGRVRCWGENGDGELGYGHTDSIGDDEPASAAGDVSLGGAATSIALGTSHSCAVLVGGDVRCWGRGERGRLGHGSRDDVGDDELPSSVAPIALGGPARSIAPGWLHTCALLASGGIRCWGEDDRGRLGVPGLSETLVGDNEAPTAIPEVMVF